MPHHHLEALEASHRGLQRHLIPGWLRQPKELSERIESSAYGETPPSLIEKILQAMELRSEELFVDLGSGAGNVCAAALNRRARVLGIERNPELHRLALERLQRSPASPGWELRCADFLETDWRAAEVLYSATARYPAAVLEAIARALKLAPRLRAVACLGQPLPLDRGWTGESLGEQPVVWNPDEHTLREPLFIYRS